MKKSNDTQNAVFVPDTELSKAKIRLRAALICCCWFLAPSADAQTELSSIDSNSGMMVYEGFTEPLHDIMVAPTELGRLDSVNIEIGDKVKAGQVIGKLDDQLQATSVDFARMQSEMTGELQATQAEVEMNESRTEKLRQLAAEKMARPDELTRAETDLRIAVARNVAAIEQTQLRKIELRRYKLQLERRKIFAPMDGVVAEVFRQPGEYITPADPAVARLLVIDKLHAVFNIPVEEIARFELDAAVSVFLRSRRISVDGSVASIAPYVDGESGTVQVRVELDNRDGKLLSGDRCTLQPKGRGLGKPNSTQLKSAQRKGVSKR